MKTIKPDAFRPSAGRANAYLSKRPDDRLLTICAALVVFVVLPTLLYLAVAGWIAGWEKTAQITAAQDRAAHGNYLEWEKTK